MIRYSQQDARWKNKLLGNSDLTIGNYGCFLTCFSMLLEETPDKANDRIKIFGGFIGALLSAGVVPNAYKQISVTQTWCTNNPAPLDVIDKALDNRQPVIVQVDTSPVAGIQSHFVILTGKDGNDYSMVDPWPLVDEPPATLLGRYGKGRDAKTIITYIAVIGGIALDNVITGNDDVTGENIPPNTVPANVGLPVASGGIVTVITDYINIRRDPSTNQPPVGRVLYGMDLPTTGRVEGNWHEIKLWVHDGNGDYLE